MRFPLSLNTVVFVVAGIGLLGVIWVLVDALRGSRPSDTALWMMIPILALGLLLNLALGAILIWKRLFGGTRSQEDEDA